MQAISVDPRITRSRSAVLAATRELLVERGVSETSIEAISERSGVAKTTIYRHWDGKGELVFDVIETLQGEMPLPDTGSFRGDLTALAVGLAHGLNDSVWSSLLPSLLDAAQRDEDLKTLHQGFAARRHDMLRQIVARARDRGEVRSEVTDDEVLELVAGPLFYRRLITEQPTSASRAMRIVELVARVLEPADG